MYIGYSTDMLRVIVSGLPYLTTTKPWSLVDKWWMNRQNAQNEHYMLAESHKRGIPQPPSKDRDHHRRHDNINNHKIKRNIYKKYQK